jgi:hypothetical protein
MDKRWVLQDASSPSTNILGISGRAVPLDEYLFFSYTSFNTNKFLQQESRFNAHI